MSDDEYKFCDIPTQIYRIVCFSPITTKLSTLCLNRLCDIGSVLQLPVTEIM